MGYLSDEQLYRIKNEYQYQSIGSSILEKIMFKRFWELIAAKLPLTLAPNVITLVSLLQFVVCTALVLLASGFGTTEPPFWACVLAGAGILVYQTLDGIDGIQARRIGCSSVMGEFFDTARDNISLVALLRYNYVAVTGMVNLNNRVFTLLSTLCIQWISFFTHANYHATGVDLLPDIGAQEFLSLIALLCICSGFTGASVWSIEVTAIGMSTRQILHYFFIIMPLFVIADLIRELCTNRTATPEGSVAKTNVLSPLLTLALTNALTLVSATTENLNNFVYIMMLDCIAIKLSNKLVIDAITKNPFALIDSTIIFQAFFTVNHVFSFMDTTTALWITFGCTLIDMVAHFYFVLKEMADCLGIPMLSVKKLN